MTITLTNEQVSRLKACWAQRQTAPQLAGKESIDEFMMKVIDYGILHYEYQRKNNVRNWREFKEWRRSKD